MDALYQQLATVWCQLDSLGPDVCRSCTCCVRQQAHLENRCLRELHVYRSFVTVDTYKVSFLCRLSPGFPCSILVPMIFFTANINFKSIFSQLIVLNYLAFLYSTVCNKKQKLLGHLFFLFHSDTDKHLKKIFPYNLLIFQNYMAQL